MLKKDLEQGMIVETKRGKKYLLLKHRLMNETGCSFLPLENYNQDLTINNDDSNNIERIYISNADILNDYFKEEFLELIWERNVEIDWVKVPVDTLVYVKDGEKESWRKRYFKGLRLGANRQIIYQTWDGGCTSFTTDTATNWKMCKLAHIEDIEKYRIK